MSVAHKAVPELMGIVNVTPDSFSDGGNFLDPAAAIAHGLALAAEGAGILDIGGESTRPGAKPLDPVEERRRVIPVIAGLRAEGCKAPISIDTRNAGTMEAALDAGADMVNDISALRHDPAALPLLARRDCRICLMHMQGTPETMQRAPHYGDVLSDVLEFFEERIAACEAAGIAKDRMILDPGIGFGKTLDHNLRLLSEMRHFHRFGVPIMLGLSRKGFIDKLGNTHDPSDRLPGSIAAMLASLDKDIAIFRVHDVAASRQALDVWQGLASLV